MAKLAHVDLHSCKLRGGIPDVLACLAKLAHLNLAFNKPLGGAIPDAVAHLVKLSIFDLKSASLSGCIPGAVSSS